MICSICGREDVEFNHDMFVCDECIEIIPEEDVDEKTKVLSRVECLEIVEELIEAHELFHQLTEELSEYSLQFNEQHQENIDSMVQSINNRCDRIQDDLVRVEDYVYTHKEFK